MSVPLALLENWQRGWSLARGLPAPVHADGGLVVEVGQPGQLRRHLFCSAGPALAAVAARIDAPHIFLKVCAAPEAVRAVLPAPWAFDQPRFFMQCVGPMAPGPALPAGYQFSQTRLGPLTTLQVRAPDGSVAASGHLVRFGTVAVFDRIETAEAHRRRGLASALMRALDQGAAGAAQRLLVATAAGQALYATLGWDTLSPYTTAFLPEPG
ncbi:GNAT family N-acetyltransferase [Massilia sp. TS11]|uniref:GNAT family N-acetyltransferase n=1 Tax=Massilia sp. TS11 TaxID=2908003 RepID=UPI001EDB059A|nr:GNAT family N-acetyltransferase [Massilia sp. TS11]MCG2586163.1 GNAT family N-acetyltransferase [Massilia sp. TS11]